MKKIILLMMLMASTLTIKSELTNGVFYIDNNIECLLIGQNGTSTNALINGRTYMVGDVVLEMNATERTTFYFSGGFLVETKENSILSINLFDQEIINLNSQPKKVEVGNHNINLGFSKGEYSVIYPNKNPDSSFIVTTPFTTYELKGGKYYFKVTDKSSIVFVMEGTMLVHGDKNKIEKLDVGKISLMTPVGDDTLGLEDKTISTVKSSKFDESTRFSAPLSIAEQKMNKVEFCVINGRIIGILLK